MTLRTGYGVREGRRLLVSAAALSVVLTAAGCGEQSVGGPPISGVTLHGDDGMHGAVLAEQYVLPDAALRATDGSEYSLTQDTSKPLTLVFFGYTHCPDICQAVMADIASAMTRLDDPVRADVGMLFVTTDPARDDERTLRRYLDRYDPAFEGLTGSLARIKRVGKALGVDIERGARLPSGGYEVAHSTQIIGVDDTGRAPIVWTEGTPAAELAEDITKLLNESG